MEIIIIKLRNIIIKNNLNILCNKKTVIEEEQARLLVGFGKE